MITKKRLKIPIFNYTILAVIFDKWSDLEGILDDDLYKDGSSAGITVTYGGNYALVCIRSNAYSTLIHEAGHLVNRIWKYIGYNPERDNDEPSQYLLTYIFERLEEVWQRHKKQC